MSSISSVELTLIGGIVVLAGIIGTLYGYVNVLGITDIHTFSAFLVLTARAGFANLLLELACL